MRWMFLPFCEYVIWFAREAAASTSPTSAAQGRGRSAVSGAAPTARKTDDRNSRRLGDDDECGCGAAIRRPVTRCEDDECGCGAAIRRPVTRCAAAHKKLEAMIASNFIIEKSSGRRVRVLPTRAMLTLWILEASSNPLADSLELAVVQESNLAVFLSFQNPPSP